jgi:hypothetical protein
MQLSFFVVRWVYVHVPHPERAISQIYAAGAKNTAVRAVIRFHCFFMGGCMDKPLIKQNKNESNEAQICLKTPLKASHNRGSDDEAIIALVKFLARRAAEEDYEFYRSALSNPDIEDGG